MRLWVCMIFSFVDEKLSLITSPYLEYSSRVHRCNFALSELHGAVRAGAGAAVGAAGPRVEHDGHREPRLHARGGGQQPGRPNHLLGRHAQPLKRKVIKSNGRLSRNLF